MAKLFEPINIKGVTFRNRIGMSPMCQYSSVDGYANEWHNTHYTSRAIGGVGLVMVEATAVSAIGRITPNDLGIYDDGHLEGLTTLAKMITDYGAVPGIQLAHAGRKATSYGYGMAGSGLVDEGFQPQAPSAIKFTEEFALPLALDKAGIEKVKEEFRIATVRAVKAGFKVIEIHSAHGYLLHEFLSPIANKREDEYGGSFENRVRLLLEITDVVQEVIDQKIPLFVRISATDWLDSNAWDIDQSVRLAELLRDRGVDVIDVSSGAIAPGIRIPVGPGYQLPLASTIRKQVNGLAVAAVGMITNAVQAETILRNGDADFIFFGRELLRNPYFALNAAHELKADVQWPKQYYLGKL